MELGSYYSENRQGKIFSQLLSATGLAILFLTFSSFTSITAIPESIHKPDNFRLEKLQSSSSKCLEKEFPFLVGLEVEEVEESKEEKKDGASDTFKFYSTNFSLASEPYFLEERFWSENCFISSLKLPLYLLFQNLRIHLF